MSFKKACTLHSLVCDSAIESSVSGKPQYSNNESQCSLMTMVFIREESILN